MFPNKWIKKNMINSIKIHHHSVISHNTNNYMVKVIGAFLKSTLQSTSLIQKALYQSYKKVIRHYRSMLFSILGQINTLIATVYSKSY